MTELSAIQGTFSDFKLIKTRSTAQVVIEIPIEAADHALNVLGGVPQHGKERWVAVARLNESKVQQPEAESESTPKRVFSDLPLSQQAALCCQDARFRTFLAECDPDFQMYDLDIAADQVRARCSVNSRREFDSDIDAANRWHDLYSSYQAWLQI